MTGPSSTWQVFYSQARTIGGAIGWSIGRNIRGIVMGWQLFNKSK